MLECPFETISCAWPRPVAQENGHWVSEPEWQAPQMPAVPQAYPEYLDDAWYWTIFWSDFFRLDIPSAMSKFSQMRDFHTVFRIKIKIDGYLIVRDDDGCIIRRGENILHSNRQSEHPSWAKIAVTAGENLEIAQWHHTNLWAWGAYIVPFEDARQARFSPDPLNSLLPYLPEVQRRLSQPEGPPVKIFTN